MALKHGALVGALMVAVVRSVWPGDASATAYDVVIVSVDRLTEQFVPDQNGVLGLQGMIIGSVTTSNLPGPFLNQTSGSYTQVTDGIGEIGLSPMGCQRYRRQLSTTADSLLLLSPQSDLGHHHPRCGSGQGDICRSHRRRYVRGLYPVRLR